MGKVVVIGGGASGIIAAIQASKGNEVILLEGNDKLGKKILLTGNGRCNYWNSNIILENYETDDKDNLEKIITEDNQNKTLDLLKNIGLYPKIKNGYYYPYSGTASSVRELFLKELSRSKVKVIYDFKVKEVIKENDKFVVRSSDDFIEGDKVILASGSCAAFKSGSDGSGYMILKDLGHTVNPVTPALVQLCGESILKEASGVRIDSKVSLIVDGNVVKEDIGELQITDYGISGICVFNLSGLASKNLNLGKTVQVKINFLPFLEENFKIWFTKRNDEIKGRSVSDLLESIINYKLLNLILKKANIKNDDSWDGLSESSKDNLINLLENFTLDITGTKDFSSAQVATGGISLKETNPLTMESKVVKNLYLVGEVLDVDGKCGGFNLAFAFITGYLAGSDIRD